MRPRILATAMDLFCFYKGRILPEIHNFCNFVGQKQLSLYKSLLSMFKRFRPDFDAVSLSVRELSLIQAILRMWAYFLKVML